MVDLAKLALDSGVNAYKNNVIKTGNFNIAGLIAQAAGSIYTQAVPLAAIPDLVSIQFYLPYMYPGITGWTESGFTEVNGNDATNGYVNYPYICWISNSISGNDVILTASFNNQFLSSPILDSTNIPYRIVDYSVF